MSASAAAAAVATGAAATPYLYVASSQPPTAVTHAAVGNFTSASELNLVLAKTSRIEISTVTADGLVPLFDVPVNGRIGALELVRLKGDAKHTLVFTTERLQFVALVFDERAKSLKTIATGDLRERIGRQIDRGQIFVADPQARCLALQFYEGHLKVRTQSCRCWHGHIPHAARARHPSAGCLREQLPRPN